MTRKLPALTPENSSFWQGGKTNQLMMHFCRQCDRYFHPPGPVCPSCASDAVHPKAVSGNGRILSFTVNYQPWAKDLTVPYSIAIIELDDQQGLQFISNVINCDPETLSVGLPVKVCFEQHDDVWIPLFEVNQ
ncbi:Zn-ribbon domain-containing OB-fold protein [Halioxenophilus aromaticivorans]|uniref:DNA-binding protein n=1 Tax=Halioxenophilus aromaticivorans TaxID=1306992 RepID=A0AAV3U6A4_9ALTE